MSGDTVVIHDDWRLSEDTVVPEGVTVVFACKEDDVGYVDGMNPSSDVHQANRQLYMNVTIPAGVTLTVYGTVMVNAVTCWDAWNCDLNITGGYAHVENDGTIVVANGGVFDNYGTTGGDGIIEVMPGGTLKDRYTISHWRGGTMAYTCYENGIYPINEYSMRSATCDIVIRSGGSYVGTVKLYVDGAMRFTEFPQIDNSNGLIRLDEGATVHKTYSNWRAHYTVTGGAWFSGSSMNISGLMVYTSEYVFPLDGDISFTLRNGEYRVTEDLKVLPGSVITVSDATLTVEEGVRMSVYDYFDDKTSWTGTEYPSDRAPAYIHLTDGSVLDVRGAFAGRVFNDGTSSMEMSGTSIMNTSTLEVYGQEGTMDVLHYTVVVEGEPSRYIEWYCTDEGMSQEWDGSALDDGQVLYSRSSDTPVAEERLRAASVGEFRDGGMSTLMKVAIVAAAVLAAIVLTALALAIRRRRRSHARNDD